MLLIFHYLLLFVNVLLCLMAGSLELKRKSPFFIFWWFVAGLILLPSVFEFSSEYVRPHHFASVLRLTPELLLESQFIIFFSLLLLFILNEIFFDISKRIGIRKFRVVNADKYFLFFLLLVLIPVIEAWFGYWQFGNALDFVSRREGFSFLSNFILSYVLLSSLGLATYYFLTKSKFKLSAFIILVFSLFFLFGGSRQPLVVIFLPLILLYGGRVKYTGIVFVVLVLAMPVIAFLGEFLLYIRNIAGFENKVEAFLNPLSFFLSDVKLASNEASLRYGFYFFVEGFSELDGLGEFSYLKRLFYFWLPSNFDYFGLKPEDFEYLLFNYYMGGREGSLHPTFFGMIFADAGYAFFIWIFLVSLLVLFSRLILRTLAGVSWCLVSSLFCYFYLMLSRGSIYGPFVVLVFGLLYVGFISIISRSECESGLQSPPVSG